MHRDTPLLAAFAYHSQRIILAIDIAVPYPEVGDLRAAQQHKQHM